VPLKPSNVIDDPAAEFQNAATASLARSAHPWAQGRVEKQQRRERLAVVAGMSWPHGDLGPFFLIAIEQPKVSRFVADLPAIEKVLRGSPPRSQASDRLR